MAIVVEYLVILPKDGEFCDSVDSFNRLLCVDSSIALSGGKLHYGAMFECEYSVTSGAIVNKEQRFFHLRFSHEDHSQSTIDEFTSFLKTIRGIIYKADGEPETLWDDISWHYSESSYALVHRIENLMRKLIANFMLVTIGKEWVKETSPAEVKKAIDGRKRKGYLNVLHSIDFIHLADFLLKPYSTCDLAELHSRINAATTPEHLEALKDLLPRSNWSRYFSGLVDCNDGYLQSRWNELYDLRCKVAHNALVEKKDLDRIKELVVDLEQKLEVAITKLPRVKVPGADVSVIAENAASNISSLLGEFVSSWRRLEELLLHQSGETKNTPWQQLRIVMDKLASQGNSKAAHRIDELRSLRNHVLHPSGVTVSESELRAAVKSTNELTQLMLTSAFAEVFEAALGPRLPFADAPPE